MKKLGPVVVGTDLSEDANEAIIQANRWAAAFDRDLVVCHAIPERMAQNTLFPQENEADLERLLGAERRAAELIEERVKELTGRERSSFKVSVATGSPDRVLLDVAERNKALLVVVGSRGFTGWKRVLLGSIAERVVQLSPAPVLVARVRAKPTGVLVVGTDFSEAASKAVESAFDLALRSNGRLCIVHSVDIAPDPIYGVAGPFGATWAPMPADAIAEVRAAAERMLNEIIERHPGVSATGFVEEGPAARAIANVAKREDADVIVLGTHGRTGLSRLILGSVTEAVVRAASASVLVIREQEDGLGDAS